jgi:hypothetical protein
VRGPQLHAVLASVQAGRTGRLYLSVEQKKALSDHDGLIARQVIRALLRARHTAMIPHPPPHSFPLTESCFAVVALKLGHRVGIKRTRAIIRRCIACGLLAPSGSYRNPYKLQGDGGGHRVRLFKLGARIHVVRSALCHKLALGSGAGVKWVGKRERWWTTPFAGPDRRPPPGITMRAARRMRSLDELELGIT